MFQSLRLPLALGLTLALAACATGTSNTLGSLPDSRNTDLDRTLAAADKKKAQTRSACTWPLPTWPGSRATASRPAH